jgi:drug/metabolite transporter (DMT)-like permease
MQCFGLLITISGVLLIVLYGPQAEKHEKGDSPLALQVNDFYLPANETTVIGKPVRFAKSRLPLKGLILAFGASACWAMNSFATARGGIGVSPAVGNTIRMFVGLVLAIGFGRVLEPKRSILLSKKQFFGSFWLFCLESFGGSYFYFYGMSHSPLVLGTTLASLAPAISVPIALIWGLEKFSVIRTCGVGIVVLGICFLVGTF